MCVCVVVVEVRVGRGGGGGAGLVAGMGFCADQFGTFITIIMVARRHDTS